LLVGWAFVWPHLAWQLASKAVDPLHSEYTNLKPMPSSPGCGWGLWG
jgi:diguanylate cyclase